MRRLRPRFFPSALLVLTLVAPAVDAGQRRVEVGPGGFTVFSPDPATLNINDHVVWVWASMSHTVTNGTDPTNDPNAGLIFDSGPLSGPGQAFSWKANRTGTIPYFCSPHFAFGMTSNLQISTSGVAVASFRITEVQFNGPAGQDTIEITNLGTDSGDLGRYRIAVNGTSAAVVPLTSVFVGQNGRVRIYPNKSGTSTSTDIFLPGLGDLPTSGSIALYVPNTTPGAPLTDATQIIDFVQWGAGNQPNLTTAIAGGAWLTNNYVDDNGSPVPTNLAYDITFCGTANDRGRDYWFVALHNFGAQPRCSTPTNATTWGRIKLLYR
jgi:plastocyanin